MRRFYLNNFKDTHRQGAIDAIMCKDISAYVDEDEGKVHVRALLFWSPAIPIVTGRV